jgi:hypothetical protein
MWKLYIMYFILELHVNMVEGKSENFTSNHIITHKLSVLYMCIILPSAAKDLQRRMCYYTVRVQLLNSSI